MLKLKLQYFGHLMGSAESFEKTLMLGKIEGRRRRGWQRIRWLDGITDSMDMGVWVDSGSWWWTGRPGVLWFKGSQRVGHNWVTELNWTELNVKLCGVSHYDFLFERVPPKHSPPHLRSPSPQGPAWGVFPAGPILTENAEDALQPKFSLLSLLPQTLLPIPYLVVD